MALGTDQPGADKLSSADEENCIDHILTYMQSEGLAESEDEGMGHLLSLNDVVLRVMHHCDLVEMPVLDEGAQKSTSIVQTTPQHFTTQPQHPNPYIHTTTPKVEQLQQMYEELGRKLQECTVTATTSSSLSATHGGACPMNSYTTDDPLMTVNTTQGGSLPHHQGHVNPIPHHTAERLVSLKDLAYLQRKEFRLHGGQISDTTSDMTYNSICKQIDEGLQEKHTEGEIIRGVLRAIKPGNFRDMLTNKDDLTVTELKSFLQSHLGEKSGTELFQDLMCAKQHENETPQQFLYRMIGLKQRIMFTAKHTASVVKYDASTIQCIFLNTICQGIGEKYEDIRRELKPLLADPAVSDEALLRQVIKTTTEESERKRRLGRSSTRKVTQANSTYADPDQRLPVETQVSTTMSSRDDTIQRLSTQVEALTQAMEALKQMVTQIKTPEQRCPPTHYCNPDQSRPSEKAQKPYGCQNCITQANPNCSHCFVCGEEGHRAVGCLKRPKQSGNGMRSRQRDNP